MECESVETKQGESEETAVVINADKGNQAKEVDGEKGEQSDLIPISDRVRDDVTIELEDMPSTAKEEREIETRKPEEECRSLEFKIAEDKTVSEVETCSSTVGEVETKITEDTVEGLAETVITKETFISAVSDVQEKEESVTEKETCGSASKEGSQDEKSEGNKATSETDNTAQNKMGHTSFDSGKLKPETKNISVTKGCNVETKSNKKRTAELLEEGDNFEEEYKLIVTGLHPKSSWILKQIFNKTIGFGSYVVPPGQKGVKVIRVLFATKEEMEIAYRLIHKEVVMGYFLKAHMIIKDSAKSEEVGIGITQSKKKTKLSLSEDQEQGEEESEEPIVYKRLTIVIPFLAGPYKKQVTEKLNTVREQVFRLEKALYQAYPLYNGLISHRKLKNDGFFCVLDRFVKCPIKLRFVTNCKFLIDLDEKTKKPILGFVGGNNCFFEMSLVKHNYPKHIIEAAKVFEKGIQEFQTALEGGEKFWTSLFIHSNKSNELMFQVYAQSPENLVEEQKESIIKELSEFLENGIAKQLEIKSLFIKVSKIDSETAERQDNEHLKLVFGVPYLEEIIMGIRIRLSSQYFWNNHFGITEICKGVEGLLDPTKRLTVLDISCGPGIVGMYLSKTAAQVICVDRDYVVEEAKKNAELNNIKNCEFYSGKPVKVVSELESKIKFEKAVAVIKTFRGLIFSSAAVLGELRKISKLKRLVLVTEKFNMRFNLIMALAKPAHTDELGNPFFPVKIIPIDAFPNARGSVLLILMERTGIFSLPKHPTGFPMDTFPFQSDSHEDMTITSNIGNPRKPYEREVTLYRGRGRGRGVSPGDARLKIISKRAEQMEFQNRQQKFFRGSGRDTFAFVGRPRGRGQYWKSHDGHHREFEEERIQREEHRLLEEENLRQIQEEKMRQIEEEVRMRQMEEEDTLRQIEEERLKQLEIETRIRKRREEERLRRIEEERMRKLDEEERFRRIREKERIMRLEAEEERLMRLKEQHKREMEEEERRLKKEKELHRRQIEEEREMLRMQASSSSRSSSVHNLIADTVRESALQLSGASTLTLKQVLKDVVKRVSVYEREKTDERYGHETDERYAHETDERYAHETDERYAHETDERYGDRLGSPSHSSYSRQKDFDNYPQEMESYTDRNKGDFYNRGGASTSYKGTDKKFSSHTRSHYSSGSNRDRSESFGASRSMDSFGHSDMRKSWYSDSRQGMVCSTPKPPGTEEDAEGYSYSGSSYNTQSFQYHNSSQGSGGWMQSKQGYY